MFGWINDCTEKLVTEKFGLDVWHEVKEKAKCTVPDDGFVRHQRYTDESTVALVAAASEVLNITVDEVLEAFGTFFMEFTRREGYENLLRCQGSTLRSWLSNINALHDHLESSLPRGMIKPVFWVEDDDDGSEGTILLHYYSQRGNLLVPLIVGLVKEVARYHFDVTVKLELLKKQAVDGAPFTTFRVGAVDAKDAWKITVREGEAADPCPTIENRFDASMAKPFRCPFSGVTVNGHSSVLSMPSTGEMSLTDLEKFSFSSRTSATSAMTENRSSPDICISANKMTKLFPYHVVLDKNFIVQQVGKSLPEILQISDDELLGKPIHTIVRISKPVCGAWDWSALRRLWDQTFFLDPVKYYTIPLRFKGNLFKISESDQPLMVMLNLSPDAKNVTELRQMNITMSDLPLHSFQRDAVFLGEHLVSEVKSAHKLDRLSKQLQHEKKLSNTLLYSVLPQHVADDLRAGKTVEPEMHDDVTIFFSDVVGFTTICDGIHPLDVVEMLNRLYCVMDFLSQKFGLHKIETIGDAYLCCSGLPKADENHAQRVADFAIATKYCMDRGLIRSPLDGQPLKLRIGLHTGSCMSGVVGMVTPRYCVFGDTVNTASRHESTCLPGLIQCSRTTHAELKEEYNLSPRGMVNMKNKGMMFTYWLEGSRTSQSSVRPDALESIVEEVGNLLSHLQFSNRRYFRRSGRRESDTMYFRLESALSVGDLSISDDSTDGGDADGTKTTPPPDLINPKAVMF